MTSFDVIAVASGCFAGATTAAYLDARATLRRVEGEEMHLDLPCGSQATARRWAGDGPAIVLLHAGVADMRAWRETASDLAARGHDVVAYDRPGFGSTPPPPGPVRHDHDLLEVLDAVSPGRPAWLVGNSQGGLIALDVAVLAPDRVAGLVLIAPAVSGAPEPDDSELDVATLRISEAIDAAEEDDDIEGLNRLEVRLWLDGPAEPEGRVGGPKRELALEMNAIALHFGIETDDELADVDAWSRLEEIDAPATVVWGELDLPLIAERCRVLAERLGNVRETHELAGMAHLPALERPDVVAALIATAVEKEAPPG